jgi:hypothetical protein
MTSTGLYNFSPSAADVVLNAFSMIQIRRHELTTGHLEDASQQFNLLMVDVSNRNPNRWELELVPITLVQGTANYALPARTLSVVVGYVTTTVGSTTRDRVLGPVSAADYAAYPDKTHQSKPTSYWFSLTQTPSITLWPIPDAATVSAGGTLNLQTFRQTQDVSLAGGATLYAPYRFLDAITTGLAARLASMYRPDSAILLDAKYEQRMALAQKRDQENVPMRFSPELGAYYR